MIAGLVAITAPSGYVEAWTAPIIGIVGGLIVVFAIIAIDKKLDDPVGALSAHGLAGIWGTLACGIFTAPRAGRVQRVRRAGLSSTPGSFASARHAGARRRAVFAFVFARQLRDVLPIKKTIGLRVTEEQEDAGLDIVEHGMYGYPEQFIPAPEIGAGSSGPPLRRTRRVRWRPPASRRTAMTATEATA